MVKFAKQLEEQLVPEWKDAFLDYRRLKKELRKIHILNSDTRNNNISPQENKTISLKTITKIFQFEQKHRQHAPIRIHRKPASLASNAELYQTKLLEELAGVEAATEFFTLLDQQLNKVNHFYETKESEFLERGESLSQQLEILIQLKQQTKEGVQSDDEKEMQPTKDSSSKGLSGSCRGKSIRLNIPLTNPSQTISAIAYLLREDVMKESNKCSSSGNKLHFNKTKLLHAEKMIRSAFIELFKGLNYLQTYRKLNKLALVKVLEKFDKVANKGVLPIYLKLVDSSYFNISDKVMRLSDEVEDLFVKHFTKGDHKMAMMYLKPTHRKESHALTFFTGLFTGCLVALLVGCVIMAHIAGMYTQRSDTVYMETVYPVLSIFGLLFLHLFLYGCNIFMWRKTRINYGFIFELTPTKELKFRDVFFICSTSMSAITGVLFIHLSLLHRGYSSTQVQAIPGILLLCFLVLLICPFNILYKPSRYRFLSVIRNIALSPLYKVVMLDFFMADQLCSQVPLLRNLEYVACYYITGSYKTQDYGYCRRRAVYRDLAYAVSFLPYYWRAMQCARRWFDEGQCSHLVNLGKYVSAMLAAGAKLAYEKETSVGYLCLVVALSSAATVYQLYWDYVKDWGLLQGNSRNPWLRSELMIRNKLIYYFSMVLNLVLRLAWLQTVLHGSFGNVDERVMGLFLAALEVIRRGQWNFYRLENEHLNNAGKFRAVRTIPLPFHEMEDED